MAKKTSSEALNTPPDEETFGQLNKLLSLFKSLDDRGLVLSLAAFAEDALGLLIGGFFLDNDSASQLLSGYNAPLGTLSSRISAAHALGLIDNGQKEDLDLVRKIRNEFSHSWGTVSLENQSCIDRISRIHFSNTSEQYPNSPREKLEESIGFLLVEITAHANQIVEKKKRLTLSGGRLFPGLAEGSLKSRLGKCAEKLGEIVSKIQKTSGDEKAYYLHLKGIWLNKAYLAVAASDPQERLEAIDQILAFEKEHGPAITRHLSEFMSRLHTGSPQQ